MSSKSDFAALAKEAGFRSIEIAAGDLVAALDGSDCNGIENQRAAVAHAFRALIERAPDEATRKVLAALQTGCEDIRRNDVDAAYEDGLSLGRRQR